MKRRRNESRNKDGGCKKQGNIRGRKKKGKKKKESLDDGDKEERIEEKRGQEETREGKENKGRLMSGWTKNNKYKLLLVNKYAISSKNGKKTRQIKHNDASLLVNDLTVIKLSHVLCFLYTISNKNQSHIVRNQKKNYKFFPMNTSYLMLSYTHTCTTVNSLLLLTILLALLSCFLVFLIT